MRQDSLLYPIALLASAQAAQGLSATPTGRDDAGETTTDLSIRAAGEESSVQAFEQRRDIDWDKLIDKCPVVLDDVSQRLSMLPQWIMEPLGYGVGGAIIARGTCQTLGYRECQGPTNVGVGAGVIMVMKSIGQNMEGGSKHQGAQPVDTPTKTGRRQARDAKLASRRHIHAVRTIEDALLSSSSIGGSARYESIAEVQPAADDPSFSHLAARRLAENGGYAIDIRGLSLGENGPAMDHRFTDRGDGTGDVQIRPSLSASAGGGERLGRRADHAGFKISYKVVEDGDLGMEPESEGVDWAGNALANDWAKRADEDKISDYVAAITMGSAGTVVQFRIIPESGGFGENYEDVNTCNGGK
ncbi:hypothetical protein PG993_012538 [Apiospora rasikravindrae]|uniref:Uncharacterized protein n=1 Tax=Apiospora rasikravindrae TaxID=990691 RepID=A0ABR1S421_9PEZI